jgi:hypothetical protein
MRPLLSSTTTTAGPLIVSCWTEPGSLDVAMQDAVHWSTHGDVLRVAAIDGCTPMAQTPRIGGANGASYAAALTAAALHSSDTVPDILEQVNYHLYQLGPELVAAARPSACAAIAEITSQEGVLYVQAWAAGDAQIWVRTATGWEMLVGGSSCAPETKAVWAPRRDQMKASGLPFAELQQLEAEFYDNPLLFVNHTPLGRFEHLLVQHRAATATAVVCATDGALLSADALDDLDAWVLAVRDVEARGVARLKATDDLAVISVRRRSAPIS